MIFWQLSRPELDETVFFHLDQVISQDVPLQSISSAYLVS
jgi:hypothetical protein